MYDSDAIDDLVMQLMRLPDRERAYVLVELARNGGDVLKAQRVLCASARSDAQRRQYDLTCAALVIASQTVT